MMLRANWLMILAMVLAGIRLLIPPCGQSQIWGRAFWSCVRACADILVAEDGGLFASINNPNYTAVGPEVALGWALKVLVPCFFQFVLLLFLVGFLSWPYRHLRALHGRARGIDGDLRLLARWAVQRAWRKAPDNKRLTRLLQELVQLQQWKGLFAALRGGAEWAAVLRRPSASAPSTWRERRQARMAMS